MSQGEHGPQSQEQGPVFQLCPCLTPAGITGNPHRELKEIKALVEVPDELLGLTEH